MTLTRSCPRCGRANRVPAHRAADPASCGACKASLPPHDQPIAVDGGAFDTIVGQSKVPVLVDFWATWCGPCRAVAPEVAKTARAAAGRALVLKVDIDRNPELAARFAVRSVPTFGVFVHGRALTLQPGAIPSAQQLQLLARAEARAA